MAQMIVQRTKGKNPGRGEISSMEKQKIKSSSKIPSADKARLFSLRDAAAFLSVSYWTLRNLVWSGSIPFVRVGRRILIDREDLEGFIENQKQLESF